MFEETYDGDEFYEMYGWIGAPDEDLDLWEAEYRGRKVKLNKPMQGDVKKFKVYVKNPGNIIKVNFGDSTCVLKINPKDAKVLEQDITVIIQTQNKSTLLELFKW